jgi:hypothetical protein
LVDGHLDAHWIEMEGLVRRAHEESDHVYLDLTTRCGHFRAILPNLDRQTVVTNLVDSVVSVQGACSSDLNARGQLAGITLHVPSLDHVRILQPAPADPFSAESIPIKSITSFTPDLIAGRRVKVNGTVTLVVPEQGFFVQDASAGLWVHSTNVVRKGDRVDVIGFPSMGDFSPFLDQVTLRWSGAGAMPLSKKVTAEQILLHGTNDVTWCS